LRRNKKYLKRKKSNSKKAFFYSLLIIALILIAYFSKVYIFPYFQNDNIELKIEFPGAEQNGMSYREDFVYSRMIEGLENVLYEDKLIAKQFQLEIIEGDYITTLSDEFTFIDQVEMLSFFAERDDKKSFKNLNAKILDKFHRIDGLFANKYYPESSNMPESDEEISLSEQLSYCRSLLEGYYMFGDIKYLNLAEEISELLYPIFKQNLLIPAQINIYLSKPTPTPNFAATPTPKPSIIPTIDPEDVKTINGMKFTIIP